MIYRLKTLGYRVRGNVIPTSTQQGRVKILSHQITWIIVSII